MDFPLPPVVLWPTVCSMVSTTHKTHRQSSRLPSSHWRLNSHLFSQTLSVSTIMTPVILQFQSVCCGGASPGIRTKMSNTATQRRTTWRWLKCLKVASNKHRISIKWVVLQYFSYHLTCLICDYYQGTAKPLYWKNPVYDLDPFDPTNNGFINDDLIIWMREAAFPNFKKLYGVLYRGNKHFAKGLPAGNYSIDISYSILSLVYLSLIGLHMCPIV